MTRILVAAALAASMTAASAALDFTPTVTQREQAGITFQVLNFKENGRTITYEQPRGWTPAAGGGRIRFTPPGLNQAFAEIDQVPLPAPQNFEEAAIKALREKALASVPADSQNVTLVSEELNPVVINKNHTYEVVISYQAFGQEFMSGIIYMNLPDTQVRFRTVARKPDFENVHPVFRASLFSWQWK